MFMKKILTIVLLFVFSLPVLASNWAELFEKQYVDLETIELNPNTKIVKFWVKALRKNPKDKIEGKNYWFSMNQIAIKCETKEARIESIAFYDLQKELITSDSSYYKWEPIIPDSYSEAYYRLFCLFPFDRNPLLNN